MMDLFKFIPGLQIWVGRACQLGILQKKMYMVKFFKHGINLNNWGNRQHKIIVNEIAYNNFAKS